MGDLARTMTDADYEDLAAFRLLQSSGKIQIIRDIDAGRKMTFSAHNGRPTQDTLQEVCEAWNAVYAETQGCIFATFPVENTPAHIISNDDFAEFNRLKGAEAFRREAMAAAPSMAHGEKLNDLEWATEMRTEHKRKVLNIELNETDELTMWMLRERPWSIETFGPAMRTTGIINHIKKELVEVEKNPHDLIEWLDIVILALDGYWRHGGDPLMVMTLLNAKQQKLFARKWPDWRTMGEDEAIEHDRSHD